MKLSGLPSKKYQMHFRRVEQAIQPQNHSDLSPLSNLAVTFGLVEAEQLAMNIMNELVSKF